MNISLIQSVSLVINDIAKSFVGIRFDYLVSYDYTFDWTMLKQKAANSALVEGSAPTQAPTTPGGR